VRVDEPQRGHAIELLDVDGDGDPDLYISPALEDGSLLYLNERITPVRPASWTSIKALYR
jgi:hypothetical protein